MRTNSYLSAALLVFLGLLSAVLLHAADSSKKRISVQNRYLQILVEKKTGRFYLRTTGGDPATVFDDNKDLLYNDIPGTSYTTVALDDGDDVYRYGSSKGKWIKPPYAENQAIISVWEVDKCRIEQRLAFVKNPTTGFDDAVKISYTARNLSGEEQIIGLRIMLDTTLGERDGIFYSIPGYGRVDDERMFKGGKLPQYWYSFDNYRSPRIRAIGTLTGSGLEPPDRVVFATWKRLDRMAWKFDYDSGKSFKSSWLGRRDSSVALYYDSRRVQPNRTLRASTRFGLYGVRRRTGRVWKMELGGNRVVDDLRPFQLVTDIQNISSNDMKSCVVKLTPGTTRVKAVSNQNGLTPLEIQVGLFKSTATKRFNWTLRVPRGMVGKIPYEVTVAGIHGKLLYTARINEVLQVERGQVISNRPPIIKKQPGDRNLTLTGKTNTMPDDLTNTRTVINLTNAAPPVTNRPAKRTNAVVKLTNKPAQLTNRVPAVTNRPAGFTNRPLSVTNRIYLPGDQKKFSADDLEKLKKLNRTIARLTARQKIPLDQLRRINNLVDALLSGLNINYSEQQAKKDLQQLQRLLDGIRNGHGVDQDE